MSYHKKIKPQTGEALSTPSVSNSLDYADIQAAMARAQVMRAEQVALMTKGLFAAIKTALRPLFGGFAETAKQRRAIAYLNGMSDHDLRDIGLTRSEIANVVTHGPDSDSSRARRTVRRVAVSDVMAEASVRHAA